MILAKTNKVTKTTADDSSVVTINLSPEQVETINEWYNPKTGQVEVEPYEGCWGIEDFEDEE